MSKQQKDPGAATRREFQTAAEEVIGPRVDGQAQRLAPAPKKAKVEVDEKELID